MRKTPFTLTLILVLSMLLNVSSFAVYENGPQNIEYNRTNAQSYIGMYTTSPNSAYHYFTYPDEGGDCTNFASQVVRAGGMSIRRTGRQGAILPWAAFRAKPLTVSFLNARTPEKYSSALTATPQEVKPASDWRRTFPARSPSFALSRQGKTGTMFSVSKGTFPAANS